jgi:hypothetical protein
MLVKYLDGNQAHVHPDIGRAMIAAKLVTEIPTVKKKPTISDPHWIAVRGQIIGGIEDRPQIYFQCKGCGHKEYGSGPTIHKTLQIRHCGTVSTIPSHVQQEYARLRKIHDQAVIQNKKNAEVKARFKAAEESVRAAART